MGRERTQQAINHGLPLCSEGPGSSRFSVYPPVKGSLSTDCSLRGSVRPQAPALPPPGRLRTGYFASFICTVMMYIIWLVFHYLIFKKPILLGFYTKKVLQKLNLCCIFC